MACSTRTSANYGTLGLKHHPLVDRKDIIHTSAGYANVFAVTKCTTLIPKMLNINCSSRVLSEKNKKKCTVNSIYMYRTWATSVNHSFPMAPRGRESR